MKIVQPTKPVYNDHVLKEDLYLGRDFEYNGESLREFILNFIKDYNENYCTFYVDNDVVQCDTKKNRSLGDLYNIIRYYIPEVTPDEIVYEFLMLLEQQEDLVCFTCSDIGKRIYTIKLYGSTYSMYPSLHNINLIREDEYGIILSDYFCKFNDEEKRHDVVKIKLDTVAGELVEYI